MCPSRRQEILEVRGGTVYTVCNVIIVVTVTHRALYLQQGSCVSHLRYSLNMSLSDRTPPEVENNL